MKKLFEKPLFALCLCIAMVVASSLISTKVKIKNEIIDSLEGGTSAYAMKMDQIRNDASRFPGNVLIKAAGIKLQ